IGREQLIDQVSQTLHGNSPILLQGHPGVGKTVIAAALAKEFIEQYHKPVLWLRMGTLDFHTLLEGLVNVLLQTANSEGNLNRSYVETLRYLLDYVKVGLVVLDDCWNGSTLASALNTLPRNTPVLVTTRQRYPIVEEVIHVDDLDTEHAIELLNYYLGTKVNHEEVRELCSRFGNLAFALEIAGRTMRSRGWTPKTLLHRLDNLQHLELPLANSIDPHRRSVSDLIDTSVRSLEKRPRRAFLSWGAFFSSTVSSELFNYLVSPLPKISDEENQAIYEEFLRSAREIVPEDIPYLRDTHNTNINLFLAQNAEVDNSKIEAGLEGLLDNGLAEYIPATETARAYYSVHSLAYDFSLSYIKPEAKLKALEACLFYCRRYFLPSRENFIAIQTELNNIIGAAHWAFDNGLWTQGTEIVDLLIRGQNGAGGFLDYQGYYDIALSLLNRALYGAEKLEIAHKRSAYLTSMGIFRRRIGDYSKALEYFEIASHFEEKTKRRLGRIPLLINTANVYLDMGDYKQAIKLSRKALQLSEQGNKKEYFSLIKGNIGAGYIGLKNYRKAKEYIEKAVAIALEEDDKRNQAIQLTKLAELQRKLGKFDEALSVLEQSLELSHETGDRVLEAHVLIGLAFIADDKSDYALALNYFRRAKEIGISISTSRLPDMISNNTDKIIKFLTEMDILDKERKNLNDGEKHK
ncbi:MAG: tetratricopeptide repeat protein, partial [Candidatus Obscuribacterales bacterium]|nr:tetratricopeptide repeat protein [Candidatus Obscuribacterales bacterium]